MGEFIISTSDADSMRWDFCARQGAPSGTWIESCGTCMCGKSALSEPVYHSAMSGCTITEARGSSSGKCVQAGVPADMTIRWAAIFLLFWPFCKSVYTESPLYNKIMCGRNCHLPWQVWRLFLIPSFLQGARWLTRLTVVPWGKETGFRGTWFNVQ